MTALATALAKAQAEIGGAKKDSENPHFRSKYADLASVWEAWQAVGPKHGLSVVQFGDCLDGQWVLRTTLYHESGEFESGVVPLLNGKGDMQGLGSAITYARRYGLAAMVGVCPEDDDANAAVAPPAHVVAGPLKVLDVSNEPTKAGKARYRVRLSDGRVATTFKEQMYSLALTLAAEGCEVQADITDGAYGLDLKGLTRAQGPAVSEEREVRDTVGAF